MDSAALLDLLGNENRRRILRLLSRKPCYVTEISEYLGVSPKAVIEHLRKLEDAGLVESRVDEQRRKYFHIARNVRLEVNVSPYGFGTKSAYPASKSLDIAACRYVSVDTSSDATDEDPRSLAREIDRLEQLDRELSMAQRWVQGRLTDALDHIAEAAGMETGNRLAADLLVALQDGPADVHELADEVEVPPEVLAETLTALEEGDLVRQSGDEWELAE